MQNSLWKSSTSEFVRIHTFSENAPDSKMHELETQVSLTDLKLDEILLDELPLSDQVAYRFVMKRKEGLEENAEQSLLRAPSELKEMQI